jgi:alpha-mannosidase
VYHLQTGKPLSFGNVSIVTEGPLRAAVRAEIKYGKSTIVVYVRISV